MSNDAQKLQDVMMAVHAVWGCPLYIVVILVLLYQEVEWSTFVGLGVMLFLVPFTGKLAAKLGTLRRAILAWTDKRVGVMSELINGIQMIKFYAWEGPFKARVAAARSEEAKILKSTALWMGIFGMVLFSGPVLVAIFCFGSYTVSGKILSTAKAYTALSLFSLLRFPMSFLPMLITMIINALIAVKRIQGFLLKPEAPEQGAAEAGTPEEQEAGEAPTPRGHVVIKDGEFTWDEAQEKSALRGINIAATPGTLTMVVGSVGSGKSSVLSAVINHITRKCVPLPLASPRLSARAAGKGAPAALLRLRCAAAQTSDPPPRRPPAPAPQPTGPAPCAWAAAWRTWRRRPGS